MKTCDSIEFVSGGNSHVEGGRTVPRGDVETASP